MWSRPPAAQHQKKQPALLQQQTCRLQRCLRRQCAASALQPRDRPCLHPAAGSHCQCHSSRRRCAGRMLRQHCRMTLWWRRCRPCSWMLAAWQRQLAQRTRIGAPNQMQTVVQAPLRLHGPPHTRHGGRGLCCQRTAAPRAKLQLQRPLRRATCRRPAVQPVQKTARGQHQAATSSRRHGGARRHGNFPPASRARVQHLQQHQGRGRLTRRRRLQLQLWQHALREALQRQTRCALYGIYLRGPCRLLVIVASAPLATGILPSHCQGCAPQASTPPWLSGYKQPALPPEAATRRNLAAVEAATKPAPPRPRRASACLLPEVITLSSSDEETEAVQLINSSR